MTERGAGRHGRHRVGFGLVALGAVGMTLAAAVLLFGSTGDGANTVPVVNRGVLPTTVAAPNRDTGHLQIRPLPPGGPALDLHAGGVLDIPDLGVHARVVGVDDPGGVMQIPADPAQVGWWIGGARPGSSTGRVVIVGHVNYHGVAGALGVLPRARPGQLVTVRRGSASIQYRIAALRTYPKQAGLPRDLFAHSGTEELVLITCGGPFDPSTGNYKDNIIAVAIRV